MKATGTKADLLSWAWKIERPKSPSVDYLIAESHAIIDRAFGEHLAVAMLPLYSGGNDSGCSAHVASLHPKFAGTVYTINTRTGAFKTKLHQRRVCKLFGWKQEVRRSPSRSDNMEEFVRNKGLPGPGMHTVIFSRLKQRVLECWTKEHKDAARPVAFMSGVRVAESTRRLGYASEIQRGSYIRNDGRISNPYQLWVAPILHWTTDDQRRYRKAFDIPLNPFTGTLDMSLECGCGCYADRSDKDGPCDERELIRQYAPDVSKKIDILQRIAREHGHHAEWGCAPPNDPKHDGFVPPTCQSCASRSLFAKES